MQYHDFYEFEDGHCNRKSNNVALPRLNSIFVVKFRKGSRAMWIKHAFEGDYPKGNFLKTKFRLDTGYHSAYKYCSQSRGIPGMKRKIILKLADGSFHVKTANFQKNSDLTLSDFAETSSKWVF